jgi:hypothetical protein
VEFSLCPYTETSSERAHVFCEDILKNARFISVEQRVFDVFELPSCEVL